MARDQLKFYIDGKWVDPIGELRTHEVINPATEEPIARIALGGKADVDRAVAAAKRAFESYSQTSTAERAALIGKIAEAYQRRIGDIAQAISAEMGAPMWLATAAQAPIGAAHFSEVQKL